MEAKQVIEQFNAGIGFVSKDGRRVIAIAEHSVSPALIVGEDDDDLAVQFDDVDYAGDYWDVVLASDLKAVDA